MKDLIEPTNRIIKLFADAWNSANDSDRKERINDIIIGLGIDSKHFDDIYSIVKKGGTDDKKIEEVFKNYGNKKEDDVLYKILILDKLYSTRIVDPISIAKGILNIDDIDNRLLKEEVDESLVEEIAKCGKRREYSFATKYCSWSNKKYVIYDNIIGKLLSSYNKRYNFYECDFSLQREVKKCSLKRYKDFLNVYRKFMDVYNLWTSDEDYKKVDIFLWTYGKIQNIIKMNEFK